MNKGVYHFLKCDKMNPMHKITQYRILFEVILKLIKFAINFSLILHHSARIIWRGPKSIHCSNSHTELTQAQRHTNQLFALLILNAQN